MKRVIFECECNFIEGLGCDNVEVKINDSVIKNTKFTKDEKTVKVRVPDYWLAKYMEQKKDNGEDEEIKNRLGIVNTNSRLILRTLNTNKLLNDWINAGCPKIWREQ